MEMGDVGARTVRATQRARWATHACCGLPSLLSGWWIMGAWSTWTTRPTCDVETCRKRTWGPVNVCPTRYANLPCDHVPIWLSASPGCRPSMPRPLCCVRVLTGADTDLQYQSAWREHGGAQQPLLGHRCEFAPGNGLAQPELQLEELVLPCSCFCPLYQLLHQALSTCLYGPLGCK